MSYLLADSAYTLKGQPMFKVMNRIKELQRAGRTVVHFEIGDPDFSTPPNIVAAATAALESGHTHYAESMGDYEFRQVIARHVEKTRGFLPELDQILVGPGANIFIYYAISCLVNPGDEVLVQDPCFATYYSVMDFCGVKPVRVPLREENGFRLDPDDLRRAITPKTRLILLNSPHNPTGAVMLPEQLDEVAKIALERGVYLYSDEIYSRLNYSGIPFHSPSGIDRCRERIILADGFSKSFAMTGWRLGYGVGPAEVIRKMGLLLETTSSCVAPFIQKAGIEALTGDQSAVERMVATYKERRDIFLEGLNSIDGISCVGSEGAFYLFPNIIKTGLTSEEFAMRLLEEEAVGVIPGPDFGRTGEGYVRVCYATSKENILEGIERIRRFVGRL